MVLSSTIRDIYSPEDEEQTLPGEGLWPYTPQNIAGSLPEPQVSEPSPMTEAAAPSNAAWKKQNCFSKDIFYKWDADTFNL